MLLFFATLPLCAQTAGDYAIRFGGESPMRVPLHSRITNVVEVTKPANAAEVVVEIDLPGDVEEFPGNCTGPKPLRCPLPPSFTLVYFSMVMNAPGTFTATARVIAAGDPNPANDQASWTIEVVDASALSLSLAAGRHDAGTVAPVHAGIFNGGRPARDVVLTVTLPEEGRFTGRIERTGSPGDCTVAPQTIVCTAPVVEQRFGLTADVGLPDRTDGSAVPVTATVTSSTPDIHPGPKSATAAIDLIPQIRVVNTNDEGAGSLRQALLDAAQLCTQELCTISFRIPGDAPGGRFVIQPRSELPEVRGRVKLDGATQTRFGGDTNPDGPEIVLDGSLAPARGLVLGGPSCEMYVLELAVVNFSGPGIEARRGPYEYQTCSHHLFPNTVIARNHLSGNFRGVTVVGEGYATIADNVITGNCRAGIFTERSSYVQILRNRITANGASGIFLYPAPPLELQGAVVEENVISGNAEWGIARALTSDVRIRKNSIFGNRYLAIDAGLDLETPNRPEDPSAGGGIPNKPVLISAQYDPATNKTRVRGRLDSDTMFGFGAFAVDFYASSSLSSAGQAEAEQWIAALALPGHGGHTDFDMELEGDFRGRYITATNTRVHIMVWEEYIYDTSEISNAVAAH